MAAVRKISINKEIIEGMMETVRNLYVSDDIPWVIGYSGGKDSTIAGNIQMGKKIFR